MASMALQYHDFAVYADTSEGRSYILDKWASFEIEEKGVYTLEGKNQSGKSILIKTLMGVLVPNVTKELSGKIFVDGNPITIRSVSDALTNGLVAVFQDDQLIPSMTIQEQLILHHGTPAFSSYVAAITGYFYDKTFGMVGKAQKTATGTSCLDQFSPSDEGRYPAKRVIAKATELLREYGDEYVAILKKYPRQLSGGAKAVARIVNAQMHSRIRILFLDEAFSGVQRDVVPRLIRKLKGWAKEKGVTLLVVTHNRDELIRWQPQRRYLIENKTITTIKPDGYNRLEAGLPLRVDMFPIYKPPYTAGWIPEIDSNARISIVADADLLHLAPTIEIKKFLTRKTGEEPAIYPVAGGEQLKQLENYKELILKLGARHPHPNGAIVIIGGGTTLNYGAFVGSTLHRGWLPLILVPTTVMAIADVAVGSKTSLNISKEDSGASLKHIVGTYNNPSAILLDKEYLRHLPPVELKRGLAEVIKHGLLQSESLFTRALALIEHDAPPYKDCFEAAYETMNLKSEVLASDPWELDAGKILLYGHLHAHSIERASSFAVPHGVSVLWGVMLDLLIAGESSLFDRVLTSACKSNLLSIEQISSIGEEKLKEAYNNDTKSIHIVGDKFRVISVTALGCYGVNDGVTQPIIVKDVEWADIWVALNTVQQRVKERIITRP